MKIFINILLFLCLFLTDDYKTLFKSGVAAYSNKDFNQAIVFFQKSYKLNKHSKTSYYLSLCYFRSSEDSMAIKYARQSKKDLPPLSANPYIENLDAIIQNCDYNNKFQLDNWFNLHLEMTIPAMEKKTFPMKETENPESESFVWPKPKLNSENMSSYLYDYFMTGNTTASLPHEHSETIDTSGYNHTYDIKDSLE